MSKLWVRLYAAFAGMAAMVLALAVFGLVELEEQRRRVDVELRQSLAILVSAADMRGAVGDMLRMAFQAGIERKEDMLYAAGAKAGRFFEIHRQLGAQVDALPESSTDTQLLLRAGLDRTAASFRRVASNTLAMIAEQAESGRTEEAWFEQARLASQVVGEDMERFVREAEQSLDGRIAAGMRRLERDIRLHYMAIVAALLGLAAFLLFLHRQVTRPIRSVTGFVARSGEAPLEAVERYLGVGIEEIDTIGNGVSRLLDHLQAASALKLAERHDVLKALAAASSLLLSRHDDSATVTAALGIVGRGMHASRAYLFECHLDAAGRVVISQRAEWCAEGITAQMDNPELLDFDWGERLPQWPERMRAGEAIAGPITELPETEREIFAAQQILSLACVPIILNDGLWGFCGLDDCAEARHWSDFEIEALKAIGDDIGNLIQWQCATNELRMSTEVFLHSGEAILVTDRRGTITTVNPAFSRITGYEAHEAIGRNSAMLGSGRHDAEFYKRMWHDLAETGQWRGEIWNRRKSGEVFPEWLNISAVRDAEGETTHFVALFSDITERKAAEKRIEYLAHHDPLTGLPNRSLFIERVEAALAQARRYGRQAAVLFIDLDNFKTVNDTLGHAVGDALLRTVAARMKAGVRDIDTVCRQGGDEFIVLLSELADAADAAHVAVKLTDLLRQPIPAGEQRLHVSASIGIAVFPGDGESTAMLLKNADMAMYSAKEAGRDAYRFFTPDLHARAQARLQLEARLRAAIEAQEFELHFQPQWRGAQPRLFGAEALLRWRSAERGWISPAEFIPTAEDSGLIIPLGDWVLNEACRQAVTWSGDDLTVAVNVSAVQVRRSDLVGATRAALAASGLPPQRLELEITESLLVADDAEVRSVLDQLKLLGIKLAIDDFGTGYSSLAYLKRFAVDRIKIDQSFVRDIGIDGEDATIVRAIVQMAQGLRMEIIAEGVETEAQRQLLVDYGCKEFQGYLLGRPMPAAAFLSLTAASVSSVAAS